VTTGRAQRSGEVICLEGPADHARVFPVTDDEPPRGSAETVAKLRRGSKALRVDVGPLRRSREFRLLFAGQVISFPGSMLAYVALPYQTYQTYQTYQLSHSSLIVGLLSLSEVIPVVLIDFVGGALADAVDRRRLVLLADVGLTQCSVLLVVNAAISDPQVWAGFPPQTGHVITLLLVESPTLQTQSALNGRVNYEDERNYTILSTQMHESLPPVWWRILGRQIVLA